MSLIVEQFPFSKPLSTKKIKCKKANKKQIPQTKQPFPFQIISYPRRKALSESKALKENKKFKKSIV